MKSNLLINSKIMKKINILTIAFALIATIANAQQVQREKVVVEIGTTFIG
jgi:hypothetical protein